MRGRAGRSATLAAIVLAIFLLSLVLEPRKTSYSCKSVASCLGLSNRHRYGYSRPEGDVLKQEVELHDGTLRFEQRLATGEPEILILALNRDASSWSKDFRSQQRNVHDFLDMLVSTKLDFARVSLALLTSSKTEYGKLTAAASAFPFARITVFYKPDSTEQSVPYDQRHDPAVQLQRRAAIAALRNYLMLRSLEDEQHILWTDADVVEFSPGIVQTMISHSNSNGDAGIITARCYQNVMDNYDKNAWKVHSPDLMGTVPDGYGEAAMQKLVAERLDIPKLLNGTTSTDLIPLDSVGGTILYIRAGLVRQGISFPTFNVVGTAWNRYGWVGVETEGICYLAKSLKGGGCFVLGGSHYVRHSDLG